MADHVVLDDVDTWYETYGDGEPLVLLHPSDDTPGRQARERGFLIDDPVSTMAPIRPATSP